MKRYFLPILIWIGTLAFSFAQNEDVTMEEVVITGQFSPTPVSASVYQITTISHTEIRQLGANNLREVLQFQPLLELQQQSVFGTTPEIQGISKENVKILIDGVPVIGRLNGAIDLTQIPLADIERIEIIQGPVSVFYGTDAMGGIINIITKSKQKKTFQTSLNSYYESTNAVNLGLNLGIQKNKHLFRISGNFYNFQGMNTDTSLQRSLNWNPRTQYFANLKYKYALTNTLNLQYTGRFFNEKLTDYEEPDRRGNIYDKIYYTRRLDNILSLQGNIMNNKYLDAFVSFQNYERFHDTYIIDPNTEEATLSTSDTREKNLVKYQYIGTRGQIGTNEPQKLNYALGWQAKYEQTQGERIKDSLQSYYTVAFFGSLNYNLFERWDIRPSARVTYNSVFGTLATPAFQTRYKFNNHHQITFAYGYGFRAPSLKELFLDFRIQAGPLTYVISGNENLKPEQGHNLSFFYSYKKLFGNNKLLKITPSVFYNNIENLIALSEMVNNQRNYINIKKYKSLGGSLNVSYKAGKRFSASLTGTLLGRYNEFSENYATEEFLFSPQFVTSLGYLIPKIEVRLNLYHNYFGKRQGFVFDSQNNTLKETTRDDFHNLNVSLSKQWWENKLQVTLGGKNLFDVTNVATLNEIGEAHARDMVLWGRSFFIRTTFNF